MEMLTLLAVLVLIALAAPRYGADSRRPVAGDPPTPRYRTTPWHDVAVLSRAVTRPVRRHVLGRRDA